MAIDSAIIDKIKTVLFHHLDPQKDRVFIYGSRACDGGRKWSDIDIGIESTRNIPANTIRMLKEEFEESDIPYIIDITDFKSVSENFKIVAIQKTIAIN